MDFLIDFEQEVDGRWIADIQNLPGVMVYGETIREAGIKVLELAQRVLDEGRQSV